MPTNNLLSLFDIFDNRIFRIPDFQRGYSWNKKQLDDFWDDIQNLSASKNHYIGMLTVEPIDNSEANRMEKWDNDLWLLEKGMKAFYLIDGQQRITTMIILVNELLNSFNEGDFINCIRKADYVSHFLYQRFQNDYNSYMFGYEKDDPSDEYFKTKILGQHSFKAVKNPETLYTSNLEAARKFFIDKLKHLDKGQREEIFDKIVNRFLFNYYEVNKNLDIHVTFETMNNRGKQLSKLELLKNRLVYLSTLFNIPESSKRNLRKNINEAWSTIYAYLGKNKKNPLDDDRFLFNHWIMYYSYKRNKAEEYTDFLLKEKFTAKNVISGSLKLDEINDYIKSLAKSVEKWFYIYNAEYLSEYSEDIKLWLNRLNRVGLGAFAPLIMAVLLKETDSEKIEQLLEACENYVFLVFHISYRQSNTGNSEFYRLAHHYYEGAGHTDTLIDYIYEKIHGDEEYYGNFVLNKFQEKIHELFHKDDQEGFYSWKGLRYFLYEYEQHLQKLNKGNEKISWDTFSKRKKEDSVEHIYPQTPTDNYWISRFGLLPESQQKLYLNSLGNLLLISASKNSKLQNHSFDDKCKRFDNAGNAFGYFNGSYSEIDVSASSEWTPEEIRKRGLKMLDFMEQRWNFSFDDWEIGKEDILLPQKNKNSK